VGEDRESQAAQVLGREAADAPARENVVAGEVHLLLSGSGQASAALETASYL
jgi:hypothetical protein